MIDLNALFVMFFIVLIFYFIWRGIVERENTLVAIKQHCLQQDLQLLDENIALHRPRFKKDASNYFYCGRRDKVECSSMGDER